MKVWLLWGPAWVDSGKVFTREDGSTLHPATITDRFKGGARRSGAGSDPPARPPARRRVADARRRRDEPKVVQETLGHASITLTLDTYTSVYSEVAAAAAEAAAALVSRGRRSCTHTAHTLDAGQNAGTGKSLVGQWGGWGSNPRPDGL